MTPVVPRGLVGFVDSPAVPSLDPARLGHVTAEAPGPLVAWSWTTLTLRYVVGHHGLDDRGGLKLTLRFPYDGGDWQVDDPAAPNFVHVSASRPCRFRTRYEAFGDARPWFRKLQTTVTGGCLAEGDVVTIVLGDRRGGSPGLRVQSFCEDAWEIRVLVDPCATGHFREVPGTVAFPVLPGPPVRWRAVLPGRSPGGFWLGLKAEDVGGNPAPTGGQVVRLRPSRPVRGLPEQVRWDGRAHRIEGLAADAGLLRIDVLDEAGAVLATSNPLLVGEPATWWGDLHGQSGETVGINTADAWFAFGRELSFLDACAHQANCFQITTPFWQLLDGIVARWHEPGRYVTLPGFEWSGNTAVGGDRNVWYRRPGRPIRRASHALLLDHEDIDSDATTARALFAALDAQEAPGDAVVAAHVGGRHADLAYAHDGKWERVVEIHSAWGTFEWLLLDALRLGHRVGVVANSDGHKGRPGASYPGAATFGAVGGLTAWRADQLDRDSLVDALRARRTWATSGARIDLRVEVTPDGDAWRYDEDPLLGGTERTLVTTLSVGEIAATRAREARVAVRVRALAGILSVEVRVGDEVVARQAAAARAAAAPESTPGLRRTRLTWEGAEYRGRGRMVTWDGAAVVADAEIVRVERFADFSPASTLEARGARVSWKAVTTGNRGGIDLWWVPTGPAPRIEVDTGPATLGGPLDTAATADAGGLGKRLSLDPLPPEGLAPDLDVDALVPVRARGDTPVWAVVTCEDGHQAWSSPVYLFPEAP